MASEREKMEAWTLGQVADSMAGALPGSLQHNRATSEFLRRQVQFQEEARDAQLKAADAAQKTAAYTQDTAKWMRRSVYVLAIAAVVQALFAFLGWFAPRFH